MKVVIIHHSDLLGGNSEVSYRYMRNLRRMGIDVKMIVYTRLSDSENVSIVGHRFTRLVRFATERARIMMANGRNHETLYDISLGTSGYPLWRHPWVKEADVIHLGWINQGLLSIDGVRRLCNLGKPVIWTIHDLWAFSGLCHRVHGCRNYQNKCGCCPLLGSSDDNDLSRRLWKRKEKMYRDAPFHVVCHSSWMEQMARSSSLLRDRDFTVVHPLLSVDDFTVKPIEGYPSFDPMKNRRRIIMSAPHLDKPHRNLNMAIEAVNLIFDERPELANEVGLLLFGHLDYPSILDRLRFPYMFLGQIHDRALVRQLYASSDVVLSSSYWEVLGESLVEGLAAGCLPVTFGRGGERDVVSRPGFNGFIAPEMNAVSLARTLIKALEAKPDRQALHDDAVARFGNEVLSQRYADLYRSLI